MFANYLIGPREGLEAMGAPALALTAFIAVGREGLETALFIRTAGQATGRSTAPVTGTAPGPAGAAVLGRPFHRGAVRIDFAKFFPEPAPPWWSSPPGRPASCR
ncbi:FTR1 family protein [Streptomyces sp. NPDC008313]|uniref:FTR1 family protein n=1 Tax=Streptomyces sp. NPDC008313 TaxID=3364826 RepID=UPI0036E05BED